MFPSPGPVDYIKIDFLAPVSHPLTKDIQIIVIQIGAAIKREQYYTEKNVYVCSKCVVASTWYWIWVSEIFGTEYGPQLVGKLFAMECKLLSAIHLKMTTRHSQANRQVERYIMAIIADPRHDATEHHHYSDSFVQTFTYAYSVNPFATNTKVKVNSFVSDRHLPDPTMYPQRKAYHTTVPREITI